MKTAALLVALAVVLVPIFANPSLQRRERRQVLLERLGRLYKEQAVVSGRAKRDLLAGMNMQDAMGMFGSILTDTMATADEKKKEAEEKGEDGNSAFQKSMMTDLKENFEMISGMINPPKEEEEEEKK
ncbi:uncharacterized protein LOC134535662 [Bacillus rossius redtenbacheri]|uniref:uncharacterized protein LOC134535662 n=1 Tax=Bacillus rossius redtenbacheri TaxID=93214 RepID=UPI002FDE6E78